MQVRFTREALETGDRTPGLQPVRSDVPLQHRHDHAAQRKAALDNDIAAFQEHDERFHAALAAGADAELAWQAVIDIKCHMDRVCVCHLTLLDQKTVLGLIDQHQTILDAIDAGEARWEIS